MTQGTHCHLFLRDPIPPDSNPAAIISGFRSVVNMTPDEIESFLHTEESRKALDGATDVQGKEGRHMARRVIELLRKEEDTFYEADLEHMYQVTQYINCNKGTAQRGKEWSARLKNFGFDPDKVTAEGGRMEE